MKRNGFVLSLLMVPAVAVFGTDYPGDWGSSGLGIIGKRAQASSRQPICRQSAFAIKLDQT